MKNMLQYLNKLRHAGGANSKCGSVNAEPLMKDEQAVCPLFHLKGKIA